MHCALQRWSFGSPGLYSLCRQAFGLPPGKIITYFTLGCPASHPLGASRDSLRSSSVAPLAPLRLGLYFHCPWPSLLEYASSSQSSGRARRGHRAGRSAGRLFGARLPRSRARKRTLRPVRAFQRYRRVSGACIRHRQARAGRAGAGGAGRDHSFLPPPCWDSASPRSSCRSRTDLRISARHFRLRPSRDAAR